MSLQARADERKLRLEKLKEKSLKGSKRPSEDGHALRFRSYEPETTTLKEYVADAPAIGVEANKKGDTVESRVEKIVQQVKELESEKGPDLDLSNLAPKKPNWDLKRDLEKKLAKLDRQTQKSIADLIRKPDASR
ncbi:hypothetical protein HDU91_000959 [Kappamyces sp. JEL0680]|nr:hypothetical protein HDU91_000959 [Kappamyces sp. JEL0680]